MHTSSPAVNLSRVKPDFNILLLYERQTLHVQRYCTGCFSLANCCAISQVDSKLPAVVSHALNCNTVLMLTLLLHNQVVNLVRIVPLNQTVYASSSSSAGSPSAAAAAVGQITATSEALVTVSECSKAPTAAAAPLLAAASTTPAAAAAASAGSQGSSPAEPKPSNTAVMLALPVLTLGGVKFTTKSSSSWTISNTPATDALHMRYDETIWTSFMVQYQRQPGAPSYSLSGVLSIKNPNLVDPLVLVKVSVDLEVPGTGFRAIQDESAGFSSGDGAPGVRAGSSSPTGGWGFSGQPGMAVVSCPRDVSGAVVVAGQLLASGVLECSWRLSAAADSPLGKLLAAASSSSSSSSGTVRLLATAVTSAGMEAASAPVPLSAAASGDAEASAAAAEFDSSSSSSRGEEGGEGLQQYGTCAALSAGLQEGSAAGVRLLTPLGLSGPHRRRPQPAPHQAAVPPAAAVPAAAAAAGAAADSDEAASEDSADSAAGGAADAAAGDTEEQDGQLSAAGTVGNSDASSEPTEMGFAEQQQQQAEVYEQKQQQEEFEYDQPLDPWQQQQQRRRQLLQLPQQQQPWQSSQQQQQQQGSRLPGEAGGGGMSDVVCDSITLNYGSHFGPLGPGECGEYKVSRRVHAGNMEGVVYVAGSVLPPSFVSSLQQ